jgi:hypothetical protein
VVTSAVINVNEVLEGHVALELDCLDRIYLNAYVPRLQTSGQVAWFMTDHLRLPLPSPAIFEKIGNRFRRDVKAFAKANRIPILKLAAPDRSRWDDRKLDHVQRYLARAERLDRPGVVAIVTAQELAWVWNGTENRDRRRGPFAFVFTKGRRQVTAYYFYIFDPDFGPGFIKICSYFPYPAKCWINGHEWLKHQATRAGLVFESLANGFASCDQPDRLQTLAERLGPRQIGSWFNRWITRIPTPLTWADQRAGYWWELSMRQVEVATTVVLDDPRRARSFFEALVADNIGIGRPEKVSMVFSRRVTSRTPGIFRGRVFTVGTEVNMDFTYKHCRVKQYLKEGRALRIETVVNDTRDFGIGRRLVHLPEIFTTVRQVNHRLLMIERAGQACGLETALFERISQPYEREGSRTGALRFGDPRVTALTGALCTHVHAVSGFTNKSLRSLVAGLLDMDYTPNQMSYDLRRLRLHGLIQRQPRTNTYTLTPDGVRFTVFYTKVHQRILGPLLAADHPPAPKELRQALRVIDHHIHDYIQNARLAPAA